MSAQISISAFMELAAARTGHFGMESGLHGALWLDLDALFARDDRIQPFVAALAEMLRPFRADVVCGPLLGGAFLAQRIAPMIGAEFWYTEPVAPTEGTGLFKARYRLPRALANRKSHPRVALVDDVMSAGSSLRATSSAFHDDADIIVVGSLLQLGMVGARYFADRGIPVRAVLQEAFEMWPAAECPHCAARITLEHVAP